MLAPDSIIHAQLEISGCTAELWLNGVPVMRLDQTPGRVPIQNFAVMQLLVPGTNMLEIVVEPGSTPSVGRTEKRELMFSKMWATGRLIRFEEGASGLVEEGHLLTEVNFRWDDPTLNDRMMFPKSSGMQVEMGAAFGTWGWQKAPDLVLDEALIAEARAVLDELEAALRAFDEQRFWQLTELQIKDVLRAYPALSEPAMRSELTTMIAHIKEGKDPVFARDPENHDFRIVGGGKLLQCIDKDWTTSFKVRDPAGDVLPYRIMLARIDGKLRVVR